MNKKFTILIVFLIGLLIVVGIVIVGGSTSITPESTNQQQNKTKQKPNNSKVAEGTTCEDSDGLNYYTKGELTVCDFETYEEPGATSPIGCALHHDLCGSEPNVLWEKYCDGKEYKFEKYECPNGCQDGACVK